MSNRLFQEAKFEGFQSLLREETIELYQSLTTTTETTFGDVLTKFHKKFTKYLKEVARYKWDQTKDKPTAETFSDFLKPLKFIAKQAFQDDVGQYIQTFLSGKLPILHPAGFNK